MLAGVANLYDYFAAPDDQTAAATLDDGPGPERFDVMRANGIDPVVQTGTLESLLRAVPYKQVMASRGQSMLVSDPGSESHWVVRLTDTLRDALSAADAGQLAEVAVPWSQTDEFWGRGDADLLAGLLGDLAGLARRARERGHHLYCWISL
jgi:hypothetical protein